MIFPRLSYKNLSPMETVEAIYELLLNRTADSAGKATWKAVIETGEYSRCKQINFIALSDEFLISFDSISRPERLRRTLSMLSLLKMEDATPQQQSELIYRFILNRKIDELGAKSCAERIAKRKFSSFGLIARLMKSAEFKQPYLNLRPRSSYTAHAWLGWHNYQQPNVCLILGVVVPRCQKPH